MLATTVFYWILVILIELRAFDYIRQKFLNLLKKGNNSVDKTDYDLINQLSLTDVQIESQRVKNAESEKMPVRVH